MFQKGKLFSCDEMGGIFLVCDAQNIQRAQSHISLRVMVCCYGISCKTVVLNHWRLSAYLTVYFHSIIF